MSITTYKSDSIMLINPPLIFKAGFRRPSISIPLGLLYVATSLAKRKNVIFKDYIGHPDVKVDAKVYKGDLTTSNYFLGLSLDEIKSDLEKTKIPNVVGISCSFLTYTNESVQAIVDIIKQISPNTKIVIGGSGLIAEIAAIIKNVDLFFFGEGEEKLNFLLEGGDIKEAGTFLSEEKLNGHAVLDYSFIDIEKYIYFNKQGIHSRFTRTPRSVSFITSRGCPFDCNFCMVKNVQGRKWRPYAIELVFKNLETLKEKYKIEHLHIEDDNFALNIPRFLKIIKKFKELGMTWDSSNGLYAEHLSEKEIYAMKDSGCRSIKIAPDSGSQRIIDSVICGKPVKLEKTKKIVEWCNKAGLDIQGFLIIGFPQETKEDMEKTISYATELKEKYGVRWRVSLAAPYPGTRLRQYCIEHKILREKDVLDTLSGTMQYHIKHDIFSEDELMKIVEKIQASWIKV